MNNGLFSYPRGSLKELLNVNTVTSSSSSIVSATDLSSYSHYDVYLPSHTQINVPDGVDEILVMLFGSGGNVASLGVQDQNGAGGGGFVMANMDTSVDKTFTCSISSNGGTSTIFADCLAAYGGAVNLGSTSFGSLPAYNIVQFRGGDGGSGSSGLGGGGGGGGGSPYGDGGNGGLWGGGGGGFGGQGGSFQGGGGGSVTNGGSVTSTSVMGAGGGGTESEGKFNNIKGGNGQNKPQDPFLAILSRTLSGKGGDGGGISFAGADGDIGGGGGGGKGGGDGGFSGGGGGSLPAGNTYGGVKGGAGGFGGGAGGAAGGVTSVQNNGIGGGGTGEYFGGSGCIVVYWR